MRGSRLPDRRVLPLIRSYLTAGELNNGLSETSREGTQASPGKSAPAVLLLHRIDYFRLKRGSAGRSARRAVCRAADG